MDGFESTVERVWSRLGLGAPRPSEPGRIRLRVESVNIDLSDTGRGSMLIDGSAGRLAPEGPARAAQIRRILETNAGLLVDNDAGVFLARAPDGREILAVRSVYRYRTGNLDRLIKKIEDSVRVVEFYAAEFRSTGPQASRASSQAAPAPESVMIFRP